MHASEHPFSCHVKLTIAPSGSCRGSHSEVLRLGYKTAVVYVHMLRTILRSVINSATLRLLSTVQRPKRKKKKKSNEIPEDCEVGVFSEQ